MAPYIGQTVVYVQPDREDPHNGHRNHPAIVTEVWSERNVNLKVFFDRGPVDDRISQIHRDTPGHPADESGCWHEVLVPSPIPPEGTDAADPEPADED